MVYEKRLKYAVLYAKGQLCLLCASPRKGTNSQECVLPPRSGGQYFWLRMWFPGEPLLFTQLWSTNDQSHAFPQISLTW